MLEPPAPTATPASDVAGATTHDTWSTPQVLDITPVAIDYQVVEPAFDALPGARALSGTYDGGAYQIEVPDDWNGDIVYYAHGFRMMVPELTVSTPPNRAYLVRHGYAWAASSYSENGYGPGAGARDTYALRAIFEQQVGKPQHSYLFGQSMGGNVVSISLELYPQAYDGALSECGALVGQSIVDYFLSWGALAGYFTGVDLTQATTDGDVFNRIVGEDVLPGLGTSDQPTVAGERFADAILHLTGGPRPYFREGFAANFGFNFMLLAHAVGAPGPSNAVAENANTRYAVDSGLGITSEQVNREIGRVLANARYQDPERYPEFSLPTGAIARPLLTLHDTGDLFVPISIEQEYRQLVDAAGSGDLLVQRAVRRGGHCAFTEAERNQAFEDLVAWVERGEKPAGEDLRGDLANAGLQFTDPIEPDDPGGMLP